MSLAELTTTSSSDPDDHHPIYKHLARHDVESGRGGWDEWSVGCICGFYDKGTPGRWFIPSKASAERIYKSHLRLCGVPDPDCVLSPDDETDEQRDSRFQQMNDETWGEGNWIRCSTCPHDAEDREVYHHKDAHA